MITANDNVINAIKSPVRYIRARAELYNGSALLHTFNDTDKLIKFTVDRVGDESKFFGFGVFQKINIKLIDINRELDITTANYFKIIYTVDGVDIAPYPLFYVTEVHRDENTNELSITAYDALKEVDIKKANELIPSMNMILTYKIACSELLGLGSAILDDACNTHNQILYMDDEINLEGTETLREVLNALAESSHSIYYINKDNRLTFKQLNNSGNGSLAVDKSQYITLKSGDNRRLAVITHTTELGDNLTVTTEESGSTQYLRDNPFLELNVDIATTILEDILEQVGGFTINQFNCEWRGNPLLEIGDKLVLTTKDNKVVESYVINDVVEYNGAFTEKTSWSYEDNEEETESNPTNLGDALKQTYARVDKVNKEIALVASQSEENSKEIAQIKLDTDSISAGVSSAETAIDELTGQISTLQDEVALTITKDAVDIAITDALTNGVDKVTTTTGFKFDEDGLTISKSDSNISTLIDEDGMDISKGSTKVLTADNTGVNAINLTANQFLIIGTKSRLEDYGSNRTGCFWIGG